MTSVRDGRYSLLIIDQSDDSYPDDLYKALTICISLSDLLDHGDVWAQKAVLNLPGGSRVETSDGGETWRQFS